MSCTGSACSTAAGTTYSPSRTPTPSSAPGSPRCFDAPTPARRPALLRVGELTIDLAARTVEIRGTRLELPAKEYELLRTLAREPTRVFTREELLRDVWGHAHGGRTRTLDSHACRLRRRLADAGANGLLLKIWGVGYRLADSAA